jgi:hypothetical protein
MKMYKCKECKSVDVQVKAWWNPNTSHYVDMVEEDEGYCLDCEKQREIIYEENKDDPDRKS